MRPARTLSLVVAFMILSIGEHGQTETLPMQVATCAVTPRREVIPGVIAPAAGSSPAWFIDGSNGQWQGSEAPIKSVWILERKIQGALRVTGRHLQTGQSLTFRIGVNGPMTSELVFATPLADSMTPGGASVETMRKFAFVASYVFYPSPGCWQLEAQLGARHQQFIVAVK